jgi:hypothetical protein
METFIFAVGVLVTVMVIGGCFLTMLYSFTSEAQKDNESDA